ncbi:MAG: beta galactosidase jelly roll domain-containing protein [Clostridia bacterium]|nr:beta galactosidase jelly roll domain-containing protein [Clostridia bacterium]
MADHFGAIAAGEIGSKRLPLVFPEPTPKNGVRLPLRLTENASPTPVPKKVSTREELDLAIEHLREHYKPFLRRLAPVPQPTRSVITLTDFQMRECCEEDLSDFSRVLRGEGDWQQITVPYYFGPTGACVSYYRTAFEMKKPAPDQAVRVCFDGVDYIAEVFLNGSFLGSHEGFFGAFSFDATPYLRDGENILTVTVRNDYVYGGNQGPTAEPIRLEGDKLYAATGLGYDDAETGWHHCPPGYGICQGVRVETLPRIFISDLYVRPLCDTKEAEVWCEIHNTDYLPPKALTLRYAIHGRNFSSVPVTFDGYTPITFKDADHGDIVSTADLADPEKMKDAMKLSFYHGANLVKLRIPMQNVRTWTPDAPYLYEVQVTLCPDGVPTDTQTSTFGMRSFTEDMTSTPKGMFYLNGESIRLRGANTMGFEQQDVLRGDDDMLLYDMLMAKACNMNFLRLTQRPVQKEIYDLCDCIGLMLQTDLPLFTVMRRTKFAEGIRQAEEMERLIRPHASSILVSYMNEPMANGGNRPHRHLVRDEMEDFFSACDTAIRLLNPDRVIKHIDGDYDPPDSTLPDNHVYCTWYNGHGIDMGKLHRGYWLGVKEGWYYGCGEFGAEGLDPVPLMRARYPKEWLPQTAEEEKTWEPGRIKDAQSGNMHFFYYDTQDTLEDWVRESHRHQAFGTRLQTEAFRRDPNMITFALHLFIDAWPSGWMKTVVDCERNPKPAFFTYRDALTPLMLSIRNDRKTYFAGEEAAIELFVCNDTHAVSDGHKLTLELLDQNGNAVLRGKHDAVFGENAPFMQGEITFVTPETDDRNVYTLRAILTDKDGAVLHYADEEIEVFRSEAPTEATATVTSGEDFIARQDELVALAKSGRTVIVENLRPGVYDVDGHTLRVKNCGMRALHFVSRKTGHPLVEGFTPYDFRLWYDEKQDMITPILRNTFTCDGMIPILLSGNSLKGSAWGQKLYPAFACAELPLGKGRLIVNEVDLRSHLANPVAKRFYDRLLRY